MNDAPLVAIVEKDAVDKAIRELKEDGCYDSDRRIREADDDTVALPVTSAPVESSVGTIQIDDAPDFRIRDLDDLLRERGFDADERKNAPHSWAVIGTVILARFDWCEREHAVGEALLALHRSADTVLATEGIDGAHREPQVRVIAGEGDTETIHHEHGTAYAMDLAEVMFSPGNKAERSRMGDVVTSGEVVFDMFAGIGYFTLPMARAGAEVIATERNPTAFQFLLENAALNDVTDRIDAYRADCREIQPQADRVVMGYYDARDYLQAGLDALVPGGTIHLHDVAPIDTPFSDASNALTAAGLTIRDQRVVKTHSPGLAHVVIDAEHRSG